MTYIRPTFAIVQIVEQVRLLATERPDFVYAQQFVDNPYIEPPGERGVCGYAGCQAKTNEGEGCIIGQAVQRLGVSEEDLLNLEMEHDAMGVGDLLVQFNMLSWPHPESGPENDDLYWLQTVQCEQDSGAAWQKAVERADHALAERQMERQKRAQAPRPTIR